MDLQEWEILDDDDDNDDDDDGDQGLILQVDHDGSRLAKNIRGRNRHLPQCCLNNTNIDLHMNYFPCPPPAASTFVEFVEKTRHRQQLLPASIIHLEPPATTSDQPKDTASDQVDPSENIQPLHAHTDNVSLAFFNKMMKEITEFADMIRADSFTSNDNEVIITPPEGAGGGGSSNFHQFVGKGDPASEIEDLNLELKNRNTELVEETAEVGRGINYIFKWSLSGIGAICTFGVATLCIIVVSSHRKINRRTHRQNQIKLQFQTKYTKYHLHHHPDCRG